MCLISSISNNNHCEIRFVLVTVKAQSDVIMDIISNWITVINYILSMLNIMTVEHL